MIHTKLLGKYLKLRELVYKKYSKFHHVEHLEGPNILVLSPHPDDDVFGCGGTLIKHISQGHSVHVVYLCSGDKGVAKMSGTEATNIRKKEATNAAAILGIPLSNLHFLNQPDEQLTVDNQLVASLQSIIDEVKPNLIYLPSFVDNHPDHFQTNLLLYAVQTGKALLSTYEIWTPHIPNRIVNITDQMEQKKQAMLAHKSQLEMLDYYDAIIGLNQYRGCMYPKVKMGFAEAFLVTGREEYFNIFM